MTVREISSSVRKNAETLIQIANEMDDDKLPRLKTTVRIAGVIKYLDNCNWHLSQLQPKTKPSTK